MSHVFAPIPQTTLAEGQTTVEFYVYINYAMPPTAPASVTGTLAAEHDGETATGDFVVAFPKPAATVPTFSVVTPPEGFTAEVSDVVAQSTTGTYRATVTLTKI